VTDDPRVEGTGCADLPCHVANRKPEEKEQSMDSSADLDEVRAGLAAKRAQLESELDILTAPSADQGGISFGKRVGDGTSLAVERLSQVAAHDQLQDMLADVVRAEQKLADGTYGRCDVCGRDIGVGRLEALPWATLCIEDASKR
jgi:DnaK suppressor protein